MRKAIYNTFKKYNDLVLRSDCKGNPYVMEKELDTMESIMDAFIYGIVTNERKITMP